MSSATGKKVFLAIILTAAIFAISVPQAEAWCGRWGCARWGCGGWGWGGCWNSCGGGWCGGCDVYPSWSGAGCCGNTIAPAGAVTAPGPQPTPAKKSPGVSATAPAPAGQSATLTLQVPVGAEVVINGQKTKSTGTLRRYVSQGLAPQKIYHYAVHTTFLRNGQPFTDCRNVYMQGGQHQHVTIASTTGERSDRLASR